MEIATLFDQEVDNPREWFDRVKSGVEIVTILNSLDAKYRILSDKEAFTCIGCKQPVTLVLRADSPHFRHKSDPCAISEVSLKEQKHI
jgi:hypothetical protein